MTEIDSKAQEQIREVYCIAPKCEHYEGAWRVPLDHIENIPLPCIACQADTMFVMPEQMDYPTYKPGTRLNMTQKLVRKLLRDWRKAWKCEKGQLCREAGFTNDTTIRRYCHCYEMPMPVYKVLTQTRIAIPMRLYMEKHNLEVVP